MINVPSPAIAIVGRHNSGKTTIIEKLINRLSSCGYDVGSIKHHSHQGIEFDYPGKDSYRHREAGATETVIAAPDIMARVKTLDTEIECKEIVQTMPGHDIIIVEGYRKSGLPTIEVMRSGNPNDVRVADAFLEGAKNGESLGTDFIQKLRGQSADHPDYKSKMPTADTVGIITDIPSAIEAAEIYGIPVFDLDNIDSLVEYLKEHFVRPRISVVIQAGGESRRMGQSKALVPFAGRPLITRLIDRLSPVADQLIITTNEGDKLKFLETEYPELNIKLVPDEYEFRGALPGIYTALKAAKNQQVAIVACDMVFASGRLVVAEALYMAETEADAVVPFNKHGYEPFHALYKRDTCIKAVKAALDKGESRAQAFFNDPSIKLVTFSQDQVLEAEPRGGCFINANTPEELKRIEDSYLGE